MAQTRVLPHFEASPDSIEWGSWWIEVEGVRSAANGHVANWDYSTAVAFELQPAVDRDLFLESTGLNDVRLCDLIIMAECAATGHRHLARSNLGELFLTSAKILSLAPAPSTLAESVKLSAHIVLATDLENRPEGVANRRGARLAQSPPTTLYLEGDGARFPTEAISFRALGFEEALWSLRLDLTQPEEMFSSAVRLYINTDHPRAEQLLDGSSAESTLMRSALETDIVRQLIASASEFPELYRRRDWPEGTVGAALEALCETGFGHSAEELIKRRALDMQDFERLLQARTELFTA